MSGERVICDAIENVQASLNQFFDDVKDKLNLREVIEFDYIKTAGYPFNLKYSDNYSIGKQTVPLLKKGKDEVIGRLEIDTRINFITDPSLNNVFNKKCVSNSTHDYYFYNTKNNGIFDVDNFKHIRVLWTWHNEANVGRFAPGSLYKATFGPGNASNGFLNRSGRVEITTRDATDPLETRRGVKIFLE